MKNRRISTRDMAACAMTAALYTALCLATPVLSYSVVQVRIAEALTLLPVFSPTAIWGLAFGCALSNLVGAMSGVNILGYLDIVFGTAATLVAAALTWRLRNVRLGGLPMLSAVPPVLLNALIVGGEFAVLETGWLHPQSWALNGLYIALGQSIACFCLGLPMVAALQRSGVVRKHLGPQT